nr:hypothetical protein 2 [Mute swan feces associated picorna-like virus 26]QUS52742.1 hypothetical protein 2 [Mute swan feces associated picorna-like virus 26]
MQRYKTKNITTFNEILNEHNSVEADNSKPSVLDRTINALSTIIVLLIGARIVDRTLKPQSEEVQNVDFESTTEDNHEHVGGEIQDPFDQMLDTDVSHADFFSRPLKIAEYEWSTSVTLGARFNPWELFYRSKRVANRLANFNLLRSKLCVKFVINGTPFHYGRLLVSYNPLHTRDNMTVTRSLLTVDAVAATQRPHVFLDPMEGQGAEMCLPFFYHKPALLIPAAGDIEGMGEIDILQLNPLKTANGGSSTINIAVFAWAEDVKLAVPTQTNPNALVPQSDEYSVKPVSRIAGAVARMAGYAEKIPYIGPYATATRMGASAVGQIATLFGYSSPPLLETDKYRPETKGTLANTNVMSEVSKLSVDAKQELTIDPRVLGLEPVDEMTVLAIAQKESYLTSFPWTKAASSESLLFSMRVDPGVHARFGDEIHLTAPAFASMPFEYWRGTMKYRFQIVCSKFHKGRMKIVYDPQSAPSTAEYNTAYTTVVDISDEKDVTIDVGWGESLAWRQHHLAGDDQADMFSTTLPMPRNGRLGNGILSVYVVNQLAVPDDTVDNDIEINVFMSVADNFEVAAPTSVVVGRLRLGNDLVPHSAEANMSESMATTRELAISSEITDGTTLVNFGESIPSFRQLLRRYNYSHAVPDIETQAKRIWTIDQPAFPLYSGYRTSATVPGRVFNLTAGPYVYGQMTLLGYINSAFCARRGGIRYFIDASAVRTTNPGGSMYVSRLENDTGYRSAVVSSTTFSASLPVFQSSNTQKYLSKGGLDGAQIQSFAVNPTMSVEIPYYHSHKFDWCKSKIDANSSDSNETWFTTIMSGNQGDGDNYLEYFVSTGEDFSLHFYLGPPIFYFEGSPPLF